MRVLLVDDEVRIANFVARGLREASFAVDVSADGDEALYRLAIADYDAVIWTLYGQLRGQGSAGPTGNKSVNCRVSALEIKLTGKLHVNEART